MNTENYICGACRIRISRDATEEVSDTTSSHTTPDERDMESANIIQIEENVAVQQANLVIRACGLSPLNKRKLRNKTYGEEKIQKVSSILSNAIHIPNPNIASSSGISFIENELENWISNLKEAFQKETKQSQRIYLLTTLPASWSQKRIEEEFKVSRYTSKQVKELVATKGHYSYPDSIKGNPLSGDVKRRILEYYYDNEVSRILPGIKDTVSVRDGTIKVKKTKRLMLLTLKEAYQNYKQQNQNDRVGFSKFAMERPKECVLPGASGTHSVCVCITPQNSNLMYSAVSNLMEPNDNEEVLQYIMCDVQKYECCSSVCPLCNTKVDDFMKEIQSKLGVQGMEEIRCHIWTQQDRCSLEEIIKSTEEFLEMLKGLLSKLKLHSFIAKRQSEYLREAKENVSQGENIIICDFAENYLFLTQEEVQSSHSNNQQVTIFPMVVYYKKNTELKHVSFAIISEELKHTTNQVYLFQKKLINFLKNNSEIFPAPTKFTYFSDGSPAQFKNKKNFVNIYYHNVDFNIKAEWVFSATAHVKGPADGVGELLKD